jgi:tetratricopeptide (TPR) repeat protein
VDIRRQKLLACLFLAAGTLLAFWPVAGHQFISYDDAIYITGNPQVRGGLSWSGVQWAFSTNAGGNWHPLTWLSHMLDVRLFGLQPGWHHLAGAFLHALNAALLFLLLASLTGALRRGAFVAALFALHPLHVQSVAWAAERKDVLSAFFFLLTLLAYGQFAKRRSAMPGDAPTPAAPQPAGGAGRWYALALAAFILGLMSKPMLVTVPFVLLLLDFWPLRRARTEWDKNAAGVLGRLVAEKTPFFALAAASSAVTLWAQKAGGAVVTIGALPLGKRLGNTAVAYVDYLRQTFWPTDLALLYPFDEAPQLGQVLLCVLLLGAVTAVCVWLLRRRPWLGMGWFWYLGMLVPVIGLVQVGMQQRADRYTYLPLIGIFVMLTWELAGRAAALRVPRNILTAAAAAVVLGCLALTRAQLGYWVDSEHIFEQAVKVTPTSYVALNNYALALLTRGNVDGAIQVYQRAVALKPDLDAARCGLGTAFMEQRQFDAAAEQFQRVLSLDPRNASARLQMGILLGRQGKLPEAAALLSEAVRQQPGDAAAHNNYGNVLILQGQYPEALEQFMAAVKFNPDYAAAYANLATCCKKTGRIADAVANYNRALALQPGSLEALNNLAWLLATHPDAQFRDGPKALELAVRAGEMTQYRNATLLATLAAAFAESGRFEEAISYLQLAQRLAPPRHPLQAQLAEMLAAFQAGRAFRANP